MGGEKVVGVACGRDFTLALTATGRVFSFGADDFGQLGCGRHSRYSLVPQPLESLSQVKVAKVFSGEYHAAALSESGEIFTWSHIMVAKG